MDEEGIEILKEIAHIGASNASTSLSELTNRKIDVSFPWIGSLPVKDISEKVGGRSKVVTSVALDVKIVEEETSSMGEILFLTDRENAKKLGSILNNSALENESSDSEEITDMEISALKETTNILAGSCLSAIAEYMEGKFVEGIPKITTDRLGAVIDDIILRVSGSGDKVIMFKTKFSLKGIEAFFFIFFKPKMRKIVLNRLKEGYEV